MKLKPESPITAIAIMIVIFIATSINNQLDRDIQTILFKIYYWSTGWCLAIGTICIIFHIINIIDGHDEKKPIITTTILLLIGCLHIPYMLNIGTTQIGDLYEKTEYTEMYDVLMSELPTDSGKRTVYKLPAQINRVDNGNTYRVYRIYFNNGGYLTFSEINGEVLPNKETRVMDENGNTYYVTLTRNKSTD